MKKQRFVITGGGTGGHIYPGLALAEALLKRLPEAEIHFVGAQGGLEEKIIPSYGYQLHLLKVGRLHSSVGLLRRLKTLFLLPYSFLQSIALFIALRPQWVLGIGGFASGPFVLMSSLLGGKTAILEPNAYPGLANRWLSKLVRHCFMVFDETAKYFPSRKVTRVGLPVRLEKKPAKLNYDGSRPFRVLIFGGSQGSRAINAVVGDWVEHMGDQSKDFEIFHQVGGLDFSVWQKRYSNKHQSFLTYTDYIHDMPEKLAWADVIICRAGIGSVAEVAMASRPALFIPLPTAADNHQFKNAEVLVKKQAAMMIEEKDLDWQTLATTVNQLKSHPEQLSDMMSKLADIDYSTAPQIILDTLMGKQ